MRALPFLRRCLKRHPRQDDGGCDGEHQMKKALLILLLLGLAFSGLSLWVGLRVEAIHHELIAALEQRSDLRVLASEFERGLLSSTAETSFELRGAAGALFQRPLEWAGQKNIRQRIGFRLVHHIDHGPTSLWTWFGAGAVGPPILAHVHTTVALDRETWSELTAAFGKLPPAQLQVSVAVDGHVRGWLSMPAAELQPRDVEAGATPRWIGRLAALRADLEIAPESDMLQVNFRAGGLQLGGDAMLLEVGEWTSKLEIPLGDSTLPSHAEHVIKKLVLAWPDLERGESTRIVLEGIAWTAEGDPNRLLIEAGFDQVQWNALEATDVRVGLEAFRDPDLDELSPEAHLVSLLGFLPELSITDVEGQTPAGPFYLSGQIWYDPTVPEGESDLEGEIELRLPGGWADALAGGDEELVSAWVDAGELERDGDGYYSDLLFDVTPSGTEDASSELALRLLSLLPRPPARSLVEGEVGESVDADEIATTAPAVKQEHARRKAPASTNRSAGSAQVEPSAAPSAPPAAPAP